MTLLSLGKSFAVTLTLIGFSTALKADAFDNLSNTTWKTGFINDPQGFQAQTSRKFLAGNVVSNSTRVLINFPGFQSALIFELQFGYEVGAVVPELPNTRELNLTFQRAFEIALDENSVAQNNRSQRCGFNDWELGVRKDVTGLRCGSGESIPFQVGDRFYDIFQINGSQMLFGLESDDGDDETVGNSPETRPRAFSLARVFVKQP